MANNNYAERLKLGQSWENRSGAECGAAERPATNAAIGEISIGLQRLEKSLHMGGETLDELERRLTPVLRPIGVETLKGLNKLVDGPITAHGETLRGLGERAEQMFIMLSDILARLEL